MLDPASRVSSMKRNHVCFECGAPGPYGYRFPGGRLSVPDAYRGYLWACREHMRLAEVRRDAAVARAREEGVLEWEQMTFGLWEREKTG